MADRVMLTIGTKKGVFVAEAGGARRTFALRGPFGPGIPVYATLVDARGTPRGSPTARPAGVPGTARPAAFSGGRGAHGYDAMAPYHRIMEVSN